MTQVRRGDNVKVHYTGKLDDGTVFDTSEGHEPLAFAVGSGQVIEGFDEAVLGMTVGETKVVHIPVEKAYGERKEEMVMEVPVEQVPPDLDPEIGMRLEMGALTGWVWTQPPGTSIRLPRSRGCPTSRSRARNRRSSVHLQADLT
jgi:peptidylprolyl isomerase